MNQQSINKYEINKDLICCRLMNQEIQHIIDGLPIKCYDNINIGSTDRDLVCQIGLITQPYSVNCCGQLYCLKCISDWIQKSQSCPNCRNKLDEKMINLERSRVLKNLVNEQKVNCIQKCDWSDQFEKFVPHLNTHICRNCQELENDNKLLKSQNMTLLEKIDLLQKENSIQTEQKMQVEQSLETEKELSKQQSVEIQNLKKDIIGLQKKLQSQPTQPNIIQIQETIEQKNKEKIKIESSNLQELMSKIQSIKQNQIVNDVLLKLKQIFDIHLLLQIILNLVDFKLFQDNLDQSEQQMIYFKNILFSFNSIGDQGAQSLSESFTHFKDLQSFTLDLEQYINLN